MGLTIETLRQQDEANRSVYVTDRRLWLTADRQQAVEDGHPDAAFLLGAPGHSIAMTEAMRLGLVSDETKAEPAPDDKALEKPTNKALAPQANKATKKGA